MENNDLIIDLKSQIKWWESKRWIYNLALLIAGCIAIYDILNFIDYNWSFQDTFGVIIWTTGANLFYSAGLLIEIFDFYYFKNRLKLYRLRWLLFVCGLLLGSLWTLITPYTIMFPNHYF